MRLIAIELRTSQTSGAPVLRGMADVTDKYALKLWHFDFNNIGNGGIVHANAENGIDLEELRADLRRIPSVTYADAQSVEP